MRWSKESGRVSTLMLRPKYLPSFPSALLSYLLSRQLLVTLFCCGPILAGGKKVHFDRAFGGHDGRKLLHAREPARHIFRFLPLRRFTRRQSLLGTTRVPPWAAFVSP